MENYSLSDIAAISKDGGFGGGSAWVLIILFALIFGNGGFFGGNNGRCATADDVQRATDFSALERQNNESVAATRQGVYDTTSAIKDGNYNILGELRDIQNATNMGFSNLQNCCCEVQRSIDSVNYNGAINTASINANTTAQTQKILDAIATDKISTLQNQVNQLQLQQAMCGVPKINPYIYGVYPYNGCGCSNV